MPPFPQPTASTGTPAKRLPTWLVSAPPTRRLNKDGSASLVPYSEHHARRIGDSTTACGKSALSWTNFYELPFVPGAHESCKACTETVTRLHERQRVGAGGRDER